MSTFHPFPRLPLELREWVWELSLEPRTVRVSKNPIDKETARIFCYQPPPALPQPVLHACAESRSYLLCYYTKAFADLDGTKYHWINLDVDSIQIDDYNM